MTNTEVQRALLLLHTSGVLKTHSVKEYTSNIKTSKRHSQLPAPHHRVSYTLSLRTPHDTIVCRSYDDVQQVCEQWEDSLRNLDIE